MQAVYICLDMEHIQISKFPAMIFLIFESGSLYHDILQWF
jgi:hypothetical protein